MTISIPLLQTKLQRPRVLRNIVPRPHLWAMLDRGLDRPLTLVCAGAGFGKSTLVSSWLEQMGARTAPVVPLPAAWLSLDENDNDPLMFFRYVVAALRTVHKDACEGTLSLLLSPHEPRWALLFATLINDMVLLPARTILVLDDYSAIHNETIDQFLATLVRSSPQQIHLVLITRRNPPLQLPLLRAKDAITEIRSADLRFSHEETTDYLSRALAAPLDAAQIAAVEQRSEGWIAGLKLTVLSLRTNTASVAANLMSDAGSDTIDEYLADEVLSHQPLAVRLFLLKTSIADHFCASLCSAILGDEEPGWDALACIDWLVRSDLFIIPLANEPRWYRYHQLFRSMLRQRLTASLHPYEVSQLHRRAAGWFGDQGLIDEALKHAMLAGDLELAGHMMYSALPYVLNQEDRPTLERWLSLLAKDFIQNRTELLLVKAWSLQFRWQLGAQADVLRRVESLAAAVDSEPEPAESNRLQTMRAHIAVLRGQEAFHANQLEQAMALLQEALLLLPKSWTYIRGGAIMYLGVSMQAFGLSAAAERMLLDQYEDYDDKRDSYSLRLCMSLCFVHMAEGNLEQLHQVARDMLSQCEATGLATMQSWAHHFLGLVHYQWNELETAATHFAAVLDRRHLANMAVVRNSLNYLILLYQVGGHEHEAARVLDLIRELDLDQQGHEDVATSAMRAWLRLLQGDLAAAARWADAYTMPVPDLPLLWLGNPHIIKARILLARHDEAGLTAAWKILDELHAIAVRTHNTRAKIEFLAMKALAKSKDDHYAAQTLLREAVNLARSGGFVRVFVDLGPRMQSMLQELVRHDVHVQHLLAAFPPDLSGTSSEARSARAAEPPTTQDPEELLPAFVEPISARELDVLVLLREPLSIKEIARKLGIAPATVKRHTINIYGKLGVNRRWDAVSRAVELGQLKRR